jgi:hypothetical protein
MTLNYRGHHYQQGEATQPVLMQQTAFQRGIPYQVTSFAAPQFVGVQLKYRGNSYFR